MSNLIPLAIVLFASALASPALATIVYTNGQNRNTPITTTETLQVDNTDSAIQSGIISGGSTNITKTGSGVLKLTGVNTYAALTYVNGGLIAIDNNSNLGTSHLVMNGGGLRTDANMMVSSGLVVGVFGGGTIDTNGYDAVFSGLISGNGGLVKSGVGTVAFTYATTYSGDTVLNAGTIKAGSTTAFSVQSTYNLASGTVLDFNGYSLLIGELSGSGTVTNSSGTAVTLSVGGNNAVTTFSGVIQDGTSPVRLRMEGAGELTLSGANTYSGSTIVNTGTLKTGANNVFNPASVTTIHSGGTLDFNGHTQTLYEIHLDGGVLRNGSLYDAQGLHTQIISTGGIIENLGSAYAPIQLNVDSGHTALAGNNSFGPIIINGGLIRLGWAISSSGSGAFNVVINAGGGVDLENTTQYFFAARLNGGTIEYGNMDGAAPIVSQGGTINFVGGTIGIDAVDGITTLRGINSYSGTTHVVNALFNKGTLVGGAENSFSPNSDMIVDDGATLDLGGYHQTVKSLQLISPTITQQSVLIVGVTDANPALTVTGNAALGGRLVLNFPNNTMLPQYTIIKAGSITGEFATVTTNAPPGFTFGDLVYSPSDVKISLKVEDTSKLPAPSSLTTTTTTSFDSSTHASDVVFDHLGDTGSGGDAGTDELTFVSLRDTQVVRAENAQGINALSKALPAVMKRNGGWFKGIGNLGSVSSNSAAAGYETQTGGFMFGMDREIEKDMRVGAAGGYEHTSITGYATTRSEGESNTVRFALYGSKGWDDMALDGQVGYAHHDIDNARYIAPAVTANSNHVAHEISASMQLSKRLKLNGFGISPRVGANYAYVYEDAFSEKNAGISNISVAARANNLLRLYTGLNFTAPTGKIGDYAFTPNARVKYSYDVFNASNNSQATIIGTAASLQGVSAARHALAVGVGFDLKLDETFSAFGSYDVTTPIGNRFDQTFVAGLRFSF